MGRRCPLEALNTPPFANFPYSSILEVSRTRCTGLHADGQLVLAGFKRIGPGCLLEGSRRLRSPISSFLGVRADVIGQPLIRAARAHAAHMFCATASEGHGFKGLAERPSEGSESASFADSWISHSTPASPIYSDSRLCIHAAHVH